MASATIEIRGPYHNFQKKCCVNVQVNLKKCVLIDLGQIEWLLAEIGGRSSESDSNGICHFFQFYETKGGHPPKSLALYGDRFR